MRSIEITKWIKDNKTKDIKWKDFTDQVNEKFGCDLNVNSVRARYNSDAKGEGKMTDKKPKESETTYNADGSRELLRILSLTDAQKESPETIMSELGYNSDNWDLINLTINVWQQNSTEQGKTNLYQVKAKLKPTANVLTKEDLIEINKRIIEANVKPLKLTPIKQDREQDNDKLLVLSIADFHFGSYANKIDSGYDYNLEIQRTMFRNLIEEVIDKQGLIKAGELLYVIGNDLINFDGTNQTTTKGTIIENCSNFNETYETVLMEEITALKTLREYFNKINVIVCEGNHDRTLSQTIYLNLKTLFENDNSFNFSEDRKKTQAFKWGLTSLYFDHGDKNYKRLVQQLSNIFPEIYGSTQYRHCLLHHLHSKEQNLELNGIMTHRLPSLKPTDKYEFTNAFISEAKQELFIFDKNTGLDNTLTINAKTLLKKKRSDLK